MTRRKKPVPRKRSSNTASKSRKAPTGRIKRFLRAVCASAITAFSVASCGLNPQWRDGISLEPLLSQIGLPSQYQSASQVVASGKLAQTNFSGCQQFFPGGQSPVVPAALSLRELCFSSFAILHSGQTKTPVFVAQRLNRQMLAKAQGVTRTDRFYTDARLPNAERAELADYRGSGYSRGHMAPAGDMHSPEAMAQSFSLANMVPQNQTHNAGAWSRIENDTRKYVMRAQGDVYIFTGPVYGVRPVAIGDGRVAVPNQIFKVVYDATTGRSWVHWQTNSASSKAGPPISYDEFVRRTGLQLLPSIRH
ncbi:MAG: DNA/RNA non-specific endonuclease [Burkholderiaceae bacterium]|nr:DNA/RNA non-specific endonuclease [Burkholderiaceae bacterium]